MSSVTTTPPPTFPPGMFRPTIGALWLANTFSFFILGIVLSKAIDYAIRFRKDRYFIKIGVSVVVLGSIIESVCYNIWGYSWGVDHYGDPSVMVIVPASFTISFVNVGVVTFVNQHFYAWRLYHVGQSFILPGMISFCAFYQLGFILYLVPLIARHNSFLGLQKLIFPASYSWLAAAALGDMFITMGMVWYLVIKDRPRTQVAVTPGMNRNLIQTIAVRMVQFNALSLITQSLEFVLFLTKTGLYFSLFTAALCKVYAFSLLISLISRGAETQYDETMSMSMHISGTTNHGFGGANRSRTHVGTKKSKGGDSSFNPSTSGIHVTTMKDTKIDQSNEEDWNSAIVNGYPVNILLVAGHDESEKDSTTRIKFNNDRDIELDSY